MCSCKTATKVAKKHEIKPWETKNQSFRYEVNRFLFCESKYSALKIKRCSSFRTTPYEDCDPVGIQPQDLQNFFSTRIFCFKNKKGVALSELHHVKIVIPLGFKPKTFRTGIWRSIQLSYGTLKISECKIKEKKRDGQIISVFFVGIRKDKEALKH